MIIKTARTGRFLLPPAATPAAAAAEAAVAAGPAALEPICITIRLRIR